MTKINQTAGNNSTQINGNDTTITINNKIDEENIRKIILDVFKENSIIFSGHAKTIVETKSKTFTDELVEKIKKRDPDKLLRLDSPEIQLAIFNALQTCVINNNEHIKKLLLKSLEDRIFIEDESSFKKIIIDKALKILGDLSKDHLDILTLNYTSFENFPKGKPKTIKELKELLSKAYDPFSHLIKSHEDNYCYLESIGLFNSQQPSILYTPFALNMVEDKILNIGTSELNKPGVDAKALSRIYRLVLFHKYSKEYPSVFSEEKKLHQHLDELIENKKFNTIFELICDTSVQYFSLSPVGRYVAHNYLFEEIVSKRSKFIT